ncbi:hypothetical protein ACFW1A_10290 [Kitasatospora sp. NPDC058965]|uniref:hypothetical protein n=1 Tax=Kitasatospora sp. NPDC058965 TaxID=3346682 RepID=UPI0036B84E46
MNRTTLAATALPFALIGLAYVLPQPTATDHTAACTREGRFGNPDDRSMFYTCEAHRGDGGDLTRSDFQCPPAELWSSEAKTCLQLWQLPQG